MLELADITAAQLAVERGHRKPSDADWVEAALRVICWNIQREQMGLVRWV